MNHLVGTWWVTTPYEYQELCGKSSCCFFAKLVLKHQSKSKEQTVTITERVLRPHKKMDPVIDEVAYLNTDLFFNKIIQDLFSECL